MLPVLYSLNSMIKLNTRLFLNATDSVTDEVARLRPNDKINNILFIMLHLLDARYYLAGMLGFDAKSPYDDQLDEVISVEDLSFFPPLTEIKLHWKEISTILMDQLSKLKEPELMTPSKPQFPMDDGSLLGAISFLVDHESYHIGQLALMRKFHGLAPMKFD